MPGETFAPSPLENTEQPADYEALRRQAEKLEMQAGVLRRQSIGGTSETNMTALNAEDAEIKAAEIRAKLEQAEDPTLN